MVTTAQIISVSGVYDIPADLYHADPVESGSLSASGAKRLMPPGCPALFQYRRGQPTATKAFDVGHAAHKALLGSGPEIVRIGADKWLTNAIKAEVAAVREAGGVPLKPDDYDQVQAMVAALRAHPIAGALFDPAAGKAEQSLFWQDQSTKVWRRARLDWLPHPLENRRMIMADYKTCRSAAPMDLPRAVNDYAYHQQAAWYLDAVEALDLTDGAAFLFVFQEKTAPYLVTVVELSMEALHIGRLLNRHALELYKRCVDTDTWPGYSDDVELLGLPPWVESIYESEFRR